MAGQEVEVPSPRVKAERTVVHRISGRARDNRLVHVALPGMSEADRPRPGDMPVRVTYGALIADSALEEGGLFELRRTRAGDALLRRASSP